MQCLKHWRRTSSDRIQRQLLDSPLYDEAATLVLYAAKDNEPDTWLILNTRSQAGGVFFFPKSSPTT